MHRAVCLFTSQLSLVLIALTHGGMARFIQVKIKLKIDNINNVIAARKSKLSDVGTFRTRHSTVTSGTVSTSCWKVRTGRL